MLPVGTLAELINNTLFMSPSPIGKHQRVITRLMVRIGSFVEAHDLGDLFTAPLDVFLDETDNAVQPDILFIAKANQHIVDENGTVHGVPDLVIEVLSAGNKNHDLVVKKELYERFGVKEYWIVDPEELTSQGFSLLNQRFEPIGKFQSKIVSRLLGHTFSF